MEQHFKVKSQGLLLQQVSKVCLKVIRNEKRIKMSCHIFVFLFCIYFSYLPVTVCSCLLFVHFFFSERKSIKQHIFNVKNKNCIKTYLNVTIIRRYKKKFVFLFFGFFFLFFFFCNLQDMFIEKNVMNNSIIRYMILVSYIFIRFFKFNFNFLRN